MATVKMGTAPVKATAPKISDGDRFNRREPKAVSCPIGLCRDDQISPELLNSLSSAVA